LFSVEEIGRNVFPTAVFCSSQKPNSLVDYLNDFVSEMQILEQSGFASSSGKVYKIVFRAVIGDALARAFVKCVKGHNGYHSCERCVQRGEWSGKILLPDLSAPLRSNESFRCKLDADYHIGVSPFENLSCGMITNFPLDYMHLICLGVMRRLIHQWLHGPSRCKLPQSVISVVSDRLSAIHAYIPREFSRKPRSLSRPKLISDN
jgi:hypothetical protein